MLSFNEGLLLSKIGVLRKDADQKMSVLEQEISRLHALIAEKDAAIAAQERRAKADACSVAGYRAYVEYMRSVCDGDVLQAAVDAYTEASDAKADELKAPHLKKVKTAKIVKLAA